MYDYEGGGKQLAEQGVIFAKGLSGIKARLKLQVILSSETPYQIAQEFI